MKNQRSNAYRLFRAVALLLAIAAVTGCTLLSSAGFYGGMYRAHRAGVRFRRTYEHLQIDVPFSSHSDVTRDKELFTPVAMQLLP